MKTRATLILIASLILSASASSSSIGSVYAGNTDSVAELAGAQASSGSTTAQDKAQQTAPVPFEPLLLLLLGSTLFSIGTAIKLVLSRQFDSNSVRQAAIGKTTAEPGLVGLEPLQGGD